MPPGIKALLVGLGVVMATLALAVVAMFVFAVTSGKTIAGGERAATMAGIAYVVLALVAMLAFWLLNGKLAVGWRIASTLLVGAIQVTAHAGLFVMTLVLLNR
jgi:hypothetical protein